MIATGLLFLLMILMILPVRYQIIKGTKALNKDVKIPFWKVCLISIFSEVLLAVLICYLLLVFSNNSYDDIIPPLVAGCVAMTVVVIAAVILQLIAAAVVNRINKRRSDK